VLHAYEKLSENGVMDFERYMDGSTWSFREHVRKPDQAIFETLLRKNHIDPAHAVFIDDNEENIKASRKAGIAAILFKDYSDARKKLMSLGVR
jgi:FMN phosphatase YigB (HAD superfamily)